jgi:hypothetical protein
MLTGQLHLKQNHSLILFFSAAFTYLKLRILSFVKYIQSKFHQQSLTHLQVSVARRLLYEEDKLNILVEDAVNQCLVLTSVAAKCEVLSVCEEEAMFDTSASLE